MAPEWEFFSIPTPFASSHLPFHLMGKPSVDNQRWQQLTVQKCLFSPTTSNHLLLACPPFGQPNGRWQKMTWLSSQNVLIISVSPLPPLTPALRQPYKFSHVVERSWYWHPPNFWTSFVNTCLAHRMCDTDEAGMIVSLHLSALTGRQSSEFHAKSHHFPLENL